MPLTAHIKKKLGEFTLDVSFVAGNEIFAILGASGCGKSMTLKCIAGIETPDEGQIILNGRVLFDSKKRINLPPQKRRVGYLFQNYALFPNMTVEQNIAAGIAKPKCQRAEAIREKIETFYLSGLEKKYPHQLSGGQQQRVALARIFASEPEIVLLDEPFSALDCYLRWQLEREVMRAVSAYRGTTLFVSHSRDEVYQLCDRIAVLNSGKIDVVCNKEALFRNPQTRASALLTGCENISGADRISSHLVFAKDWGVMLKLESTVPEEIRGVRIRAQHLEIGSDSIENRFHFRIDRVLPTPFSQILELSLVTQEESPFLQPLLFELPCSNAAFPSFSTGEFINVCLPIHQLILFNR